MTDPSSASRRRRRRSGRHQQPHRRPQSTPLPPEEARRNRDAAFGSPNPKRTWIGSASDSAPSAPSPVPSSAEPSASPAAPSAPSAEPSASPAEPAGAVPATEQRAVRSAPPGSSAARRTATGADASGSDAPGSEPPTAHLSPVEDGRGTPSSAPRRPRGRRAAFPLEELGSAGTQGAAGAADAVTASPASGAAASGPPAEPRTSEPAGRRRARPSAEPSTEQDLWATGAGSASAQDRDASRTPTDDWTVREDADAPQRGAEPLAPPVTAAGDASADRKDPTDPRAAAGPTVVPGRTTSVSGASGPPEGSGPPDGTGPTDHAGGSGPSDGAGDGGASGPDDGSGGDAASRGRSSGAGDEEGSLPKVAFWTVLTSLLPGSGLVTTRMRRIGWALLVVMSLVIIAAAVFLLVGDPFRTGVMLATKRGVLIAAMLAVAVVGLVWALQIVAANLAHTTRQRLEGSKRYLALALAALMVVGVAVPFGRGVQSLWALQGLMGSESVFGGGEGRDHPFTSGKDPWENTERLNIMLLGQDAGDDRTGTRPDTIMVASIDTASGQTALFSIPRNLENVEFPEGTPAAEEFPNGFDYFGTNQNLINAVWTWADDRPDLFPNDPEPGLTATRWAVEETLGLEMDYYAMVNLQGFEDLVNALGGVELVVERRIPIGGGAADVEGYIEPGEQKLDGFDALWYARSREGSNDFNRMCRQQRIVRAVAEEADPTSLALSIPGLVNATEENIQTDIPVSNVDAFVDLALRVKDGGFTSYPITQDVTYSGNPDFEYLEEWVAASIEDSMEQDETESVLGETEPGSTEPADTGAPPEGEEDGSEEGTDTEEEPPTDEETTDEEGAEDEDETSAPEIEKDPLKSCLPGYDE
ncbi:LCP family glycopolymer transferase [Brachybacterium sp. AOP43-C2-M15]|uniref:LCP family glycopolymer transferase n=1 Tax=Brachybacterium sp. AOP43-C2-M15 TaxID=3457661 RepID=UPI00403415CA